MRPLERKVALVLAALALGASAQDVFRWDPREKPAPRVGAKFFEELTKTDHQWVHCTVNPEMQSDDRLDADEELRLVHEVAAVASGRVSEDRIRVETWSRLKQGGTRDGSLQGASITIEGLGAARTSSIQSDKPASDAAQAWVRSQLVKRGAGEPGLDELDWPFILPATPTADGGAWKLDPVSLAREVLGPSSQIDPARSHAEGKLSNVRVEKGVHVGHVSVAASLVLASWRGAPVTWSEGGTLALHWDLDLSLEPAKRDAASGTITLSVRGKGKAKPADSAPLLVTLEETSKVELRKGPVE